MTALWILVGLAALVVVASQRAVARREGRRAVKAYHHSLDTLDQITTHTREGAAPHPMQVQAHVRLVRDRTADAGPAPTDAREPAPAGANPASAPHVPVADTRRARRRSRARSRARRAALITAVAAVIVVAALLAVAAWGGYAAPRL